MRSAGFCAISPVSAGNKKIRANHKNQRYQRSIFSATKAPMMHSGNQHSCIRGKKLFRLKTKLPKLPSKLPKLFSHPRVGFYIF
jgi:hypothetical protein